MKYCTRCGKENLDGAAFCEVCGTSFAVAVTPAPPSAPPETSGLAIASLISGCLFFVFPAAIVAVILGHISHSQIRKSGGRLKGGGLAVAGLVLGYLGVAIIPILIIAAIAIPNLLRAKIAANEAAAVGSLRTIDYGAVEYKARYAAGFPPSLESLGPPPNGAQPSEAHADMIDVHLASGARAGYIFRYQPTRSRAENVADGFTVTADPVTDNQTGHVHYFVDETGVIRFRSDGPADANSQALQ